MEAGAFDRQPRSSASDRDAVKNPALDRALVDGPPESELGGADTQAVDALLQGEGHGGLSC